jgi:hypothetical protein
MKMWLSHRAAAAVVLFAVPLAWASLTENAFAAEPSESLGVAETAYEQVDFQATYQAACRGLEHGHASMNQTFRLHVLCGIASASLEKADEARDHFKIALAIRPSLHLERDLSPKIRGPYLEAQGYWSKYDDRLSLKAASRTGRALALHINLADPAHLGHEVRIYWRMSGETKFRQIDKEPESVIVVGPLPERSEMGFDYYVQLVDTHGNTLIELGSLAEPIEVASQEKRIGVPRPGKEATAFGVQNSGGERSQWLPLTLIGAGAASVGVGVYFNVLREKAASTWNGSSCEQPGLTRLEQCTSVNLDRIHAERAAIGLYAAGGFLLASGIAVWAVTKHGNTEAHHRMPSASSTLKVDCAPVLPLAVVACSGQF